MLSRRSLEVLREFIKIALGVTVALVWNAPITAITNSYIDSPSVKLFVLLFFALLVTAVAVIIVLGYDDVVERTVDAPPAPPVAPPVYTPPAAPAAPVYAPPAPPAAPVYGQPVYQPPAPPPAPPVYQPVEQPPTTPPAV